MRHVLQRPTNVTLSTGKNVANLAVNPNMAACKNVRSTALLNSCIYTSNRLEIRYPMRHFWQTFHKILQWQPLPLLFTTCTASLVGCGTNYCSSGWLIFFRKAVLLICLLALVKTKVKRNKIQWRWLVYRTSLWWHISSKQWNSNLKVCLAENMGLSPGKYAGCCGQLYLYSSGKCLVLCIVRMLRISPLRTCHTMQ